MYCIIGIVTTQCDEMNIKKATLDSMIKNIKEKCNNCEIIEHAETEPKTSPSSCARGFHNIFLTNSSVKLYDGDMLFEDYDSAKKYFDELIKKLTKKQDL